MPLPLGLPRVVPTGGEIVDGIFVPEGVSLPEMAPVHLILIAFSVDNCVHKSFRS